ncbi:alpha/beta fold hydrolase [Rarobacter incanus]|uniref:Pimeloyl-ACP methyl ester carboxylesterase n=1 Tax=Rarobacter incanus TaxID=153494 RepID=A0A542SRI7_9MICO|nr:alpha/beta hydrolase [Rarobacter incanus]TQK77231.1 pimeloyl-ACP methyl ester carboxylesterase [Rarobacter incanus]
MPTLSVPGANLDVELSDEGGHPVVQLHGLTSSRARDRRLRLDLGRGLSGTRLLRYDARGHGRSTARPVADNFRWTALAGDLLCLLERWFPDEPVHGVGTSMGAGTLLHAAVRDPGRFDGLTLLLPPTAWQTRRAQGSHYLAAADLIESGGMEAFLAADRDAPRPPAAVPDDHTVPDIAADLLPAAFRGAAASDLPDPGELASIRVPVTLLGWVDDPSHPLSTARRLAEVLPHAALHVARTPQDVATWPALLRESVPG